MVFLILQWVPKIQRRHLQDPEQPQSKRFLFFFFLSNLENFSETSKLMFLG